LTACWRWSGSRRALRTAGHGGEIVCAVLGVIVVLVAGSIWRRRKLRHVEHAAQSMAGEAAQPIDRRKASGLSDRPSATDRGLFGNCRKTGFPTHTGGSDGLTMS